MLAELIDRAAIARVKELADYENIVATEWENREEELDEDGKQVAEYPPEEYWLALEAWLEGYDPATFPMAADQMRALKLQYVHYMAVGTTPDRKFWTIRNEAQDAVYQDIPDPSFPDSVAEMTAAGITDVQIARTWDLTEDGSPRIDLVMRERAAPGTILTEEYRTKWWDKRLAMMGWGRDTGPVVREGWEDEVVVASLEQMIREDANLEQIADVKAKEYNTDPQEWEVLVANLAYLMRHELAPNSQAVINRAGSDWVKKITGHEPVVPGATGAGSYGKMRAPGKTESSFAMREIPAKAIAASVVRLFEQGHDADAIAAEEELSISEVRGILRTYSVNREEFEEATDGERETQGEGALDG